MALGGGTFLTQNKVLPGTYINFVSAKKASASLSDRGYVAFPCSLDWGENGKVFTVEAEDFFKDSLRIFGYGYDADELKHMRELFKNARTVYFYRVNGGGDKAAGQLGTAKYAGKAGNNIKVVVTADADVEDSYKVETYVGSTKIDVQTASGMSDLNDNDFVVFKSSATLEATAGDVFTGGTNSDPAGTNYQAALAALEEYSFNVLGCESSSDTIKALFVAYTKRMRDDVGAKFQTVIHKSAADYEGVINLVSTPEGAESSATDLVYWITGAEAACAVNASLTNKIYDGEFLVDSKKTQTELQTAITSGQIVFHRVGSDVRILSDINSLVTTTDTKGEDFKENQVVRVLDQIGNDIAAMFNSKYIGKVQNDASGRVSLWGDIVAFLTKLNDIRAIEDFDGEDVTVEKGEAKNAVSALVYVNPVCAMAKLYMTVKVQ